ncbi:hypothetical protein ACFX2F_027702 [Malus domestica]
MRVWVCRSRSNEGKEDREMSRLAHASMPHISHTSHSLQALRLSIPAWPLTRACLGSLANTCWASSLGLFGPVPAPVPRAGAHDGSALREGPSFTLQTQQLLIINGI